jgi:biopolymer transport protein ExbD
MPSGWRRRPMPRDWMGVRVAEGNGVPRTFVIGADARVRHQSVVNVMEAARLCGYSRITFTTQQPRR